MRLGENQSRCACESEEGSVVGVCGQRFPGVTSITTGWLAWAADNQTRTVLGVNTGLPTLDAAVPLYLLDFTVSQKRKLAAPLLSGMTTG